MFNHLKRLKFHTIILLDPICLSSLLDKPVLAHYLLYWEELKVTVRVTSQPEVCPYRLSGIGMARLGSGTHMLTTPNLGWPTGNTNILRTLHPSTGTTGLLAGDSVHHPRCVAGNGAGDGEGLSGIVTGVGTTVRGVQAGGAIDSVIALLKTLCYLPPVQSVVRGRNFTPAQNIPQ